MMSISILRLITFYFQELNKSKKSINKFGLSGCLFVCLFVSNKRQNGWTARANIFCGISRDPREGLWMIKFSKICLHQNLILENFKNPQKMFSKICEIFCFWYLLTRRTPMYFISNVYKWNKRWARSALKALLHIFHISFYYI